MERDPLSSLNGSNLLDLKAWRLRRECQGSFHVYQGFLAGLPLPELLQEVEWYWGEFQKNQTTTKEFFQLGPLLNQEMEKRIT